MAHLRIEVDGKQWFDAEVEGWTPPPELPENPARIPVSALPSHVRDALDKAMLKALETVGIRVTGYERIP